MHKNPGCHKNLRFHYIHTLFCTGSCTGRVFKYNFGTEKLSLLISGLCAPVGIEIVAEDNFLIITEAGQPRIRVVQLNTTTTIKYVPLPGWNSHLLGYTYIFYVYINVKQ